MKTVTTKRPTGSNADEWRLFLEEYAGNLDFLAVQIAEALDAAERRYISAVKGRGEFRQAYRDQRDAMDKMDGG